MLSTSNTRMRKKEQLRDYEDSSDDGVDDKSKL